MVDALASRLLSLGLGSEALGELQQVLIQELVEGSSVERALSICPSQLITDLTAALLRRTEDKAYEERESVQQAYATALRRAERQLAVMNAAFEASVTAAALWTRDGEITYVNQAFLAMWGWEDPKDVLTKDASTLWENAAPFDTVNAFIQEAGGWVGKLTAVHRDGNRFTVMLAASVVEPDEDVAPFVVGCFVDMTYREKLNSLLWNMVDRLRTLRRVDHGILAARDAEAVAEAALKHIRELIPCRRASVTVFEPGDEEADFLAAVPKADYEIELETGMRMAGFGDVRETLQQGQVHVIDDVRCLPLPADTAGRLEGREAHTLAVVPLRCEGRLIGALNMGFEDPDKLTDRHAAIAEEVADSLAVAIRHTELDQAVRQQKEQLLDMTARLAEADETERRRLARNLHDRMGQRLTALGINLNVMKASLNGERYPELRSRLDDSLTLVKEITQRVRRVIADLRPPMLDDYGLLSTLRWCGERLEERGDVEVVVSGKEPSPRLGSPVEDALVRITQEALTNVLKHSQASCVTIALVEEDAGLRLEIEDDGVGFSSEAGDGRDRQKWGLTTMRERARAVGARCRVESEPGKGTTVIVEVSL